MFFTSPQNKNAAKKLCEGLKPMCLIFLGKKTMKLERDIMTQKQQDLDVALEVTHLFGREGGILQASWSQEELQGKC